MSSKCSAIDESMQLQKYKNGRLLSLSLSDQLSNCRACWMGPIKIELSQRVLNMTAIKRDSVPKVQVERLKLQRSLEEAASNAAAVAAAASNNNSNTTEHSEYSQSSIVSPSLKDEFLFTSAHDQIKSFSVTQLR